MLKIDRLLFGRVWWCLILGIISLGLAGCGLAQSYPQKSYYDLTFEAGPESSQNRLKKYTMVLGQISVASNYEGRSLVYKVGANRFETDFYNELVAPPARLLADFTTRFMGAFNHKMEVLKTPGIKLADFGLELYLDTFYGDYSQSPPVAAISLKFIVTDLRPSTPKVILSKIYTDQTPIKNQSPADMVDGLSLCLTHILSELNKDLSAVAR